ncbi:MAG: diguanylate cyclase [Gammaproteobacteria bacterium]|nr:diguanylate cyclase [Gammaproteobacteria bacterium]
MRGTSSLKILEEQVRLIYENAFPANLTVIGVALGFAFIAFEKVDQQALLVWCASIILAAGIRIYLCFQYRAESDSRTPKQWASIYILATFMVGVAWAGMVQFLFFSDDFLIRSTVMMIIFSLAAFSVPVLSSLMPAILVYFLPPTVTLFFAYVFDDIDGSGLFALSTLLLTLLIVMLARHSNHTIMTWLRVQQQNDLLISQLNDEIDQRKAAQFQLERHGEELEELVRKRTKQLIETNKDLEKEIADRKRAEENLKHLAHHDSLTNLPNRLLLDDRINQAIERARRTKSKIAILFLDLDHFKHVNDSLGHSIGDELLLKVSWRLRGCVREIDTVSRLGGDEFIVVMEQVAHIGDINKMANKLRASIGETFQIQGHSLTIGTSIGISIYPQDGDQVESLLKNADKAMYQAKQKGRNRYAFYTAAATDAASELSIPS